MTTLTTERRATSARSRWMLPVLLCAPFMVQVDVTIVNVATPSIRADLGASGAELEWVVGAYIVSYAMLLMTWARMGQTHGHRRIFVLGVGVFTLASLACGLAADAPTLIAARAAQGVGAAMMFPQVLTVIQLHFSGSARARAIALYGIALSSGAVTGQLLGGVLIAAGGTWRSIFMINVPVGVAVIVGARRLVPAGKAGNGGGVDFAGVAVLSLAMLLVMVPLTVGRDVGWAWWTWLCLGAAVVVLAGFGAHQRRRAASGRAPLVNLAALTAPPVYWALAALTLATGTYYALLFIVAQYVQHGLGRGALASGLVVVPWVAAFGLAGQLVRRASARVAAVLPAVGCLTLAASFGLVALGLAGSLPMLALALGVGGLGLGTNFAALIGHLTTVAAADHAADISGVATTVMQIGGAVALAGFGTLYLSLGRDAFPRTALGLCAAAGVAAVAALLATRRRRSAVG